MKFISKARNGIFWNNGKPIRFVNCAYETTVKAEIDALEKAGYKSDGKKDEAKEGK